MNNKTKWFFISLLGFLLLSTFISAIPAGPVIDYESNSTYVAPVVNRSEDEKGTITTVTLNMNQQDFKWKAYVGNVTGKLALDDANAKSIYDWAMAAVMGEVYATRSAAVNWANISCVNQTVIDDEQSALGMLPTSVDNINSTFIYNAHSTFLIGTNTIANSTCRSTATYINDAAQVVDEDAYFQEILLKDDITSSLIYSTIINNDQAGFDGAHTYDFQLLLAENESSAVPSIYYFYVELG